MLGCTSQGQLLSASLVDYVMPAAPEVPHYPHPLPRHAVDEVLCLARAIEKASYHAVGLYSDGEFSWPAAPVSNPTRLALAA